MDKIQKAVAWFESRAACTPMAGAREMFQTALEALREKAARDTPGADTVQVIRCKDCALRGTVACTLDGLYYKINHDNDYCSYGRKG